VVEAVVEILMTSYLLTTVMVPQERTKSNPAAPGEESAAEAVFEPERGTPKRELSLLNIESTFSSRLLIIFFILCSH
jgi:hypothetical protein